MLLSRLPPSITHLVLVFLLAAPLLSLANPARPGRGPGAVAGKQAKTPAKAPVVRNAPGQPAKVAARQAAQPTRRMGQRKVKKAEPLKKKDYSSFLCPGGSVACPLYAGDEVTPESVSELESSLSSLADWFKLGFECVELETELNSCGGCLALGAGQDCSDIVNARATGCEAGSCVVYSCFDGYVVSPDRLTCVKKGTATPATPVTAVQADGNDQHVLEAMRR